jgi:hypothetical protein
MESSHNRQALSSGNLGASRKAKVIGLLILLSVTLGLRIWNLPALHTLRDGDELGYLSDGLLLWEGMTPGFKMAPGGPLTWTTWSIVAFQSAKKLYALHFSEKRTPSILKPYIAVEQTLFDTYHDLAFLRRAILLVIISLTVLATWGAFLMGYKRAGLSGGILAGGMVALLPLFVELSGTARPYMIAWSFAVIAHYFAATHCGSRRLLGAAIFVGLSVASRIEMVGFIPFVLWEFWYHADPQPFRHLMAKFVGITVLTALLVSPWLVTNLLGNVRTVMTVRFLGPPENETWLDMLRSLVWTQGLGPLILLILGALCLGPRDTRTRTLTLLLGTVVLTLTLLKPTGFGLRHHGPALLVLITSGPLALQYLRSRWTRVVPMVTIFVLFIPALQTFHGVCAAKSLEVTDESTAWVEQHVPEGTLVYLRPSLYDPLPTKESADDLWTQVTDRTCWQTKFSYGAGRFKIAADAIPRALSEENLIQERGNRRRWFILGSANAYRVPRFTIKIFSGGSPFDIPEDRVTNEFKRTGGVLIWRGSAPQSLGIPSASWTGKTGTGTFIYESDVRKFRCAPDQEAHVPGHHMTGKL